MIFDSEEQKRRVIDLIGEVPVQTTIKGVLSGASESLTVLMDRMVGAAVVDPGDQTIMLLDLAARKKREEGG